MAERYKKGESLRAIALSYGVTPPTVMKYLHDLGVQTRPRGHRVPTGTLVEQEKRRILAERRKRTPKPKPEYTPVFSWDDSDD